MTDPCRPPRTVPMCARCLVRSKTCEPVKTVFRSLMLCDACRSAPSTERWIRRVDLNRLRLEQMGRVGLFRSLDAALENIPLSNNEDDEL